MGTNYYFFTKNKEAARMYFGEIYQLVDCPDFGYEIHVAKTSCGWLPLFYAHEHCHSVGELTSAFNSGEFQIFDEYGKEYFWAKFTEEVLRYNGGIDGALPKNTCKFDSEKTNYNNMPDQIPFSHIEYGKRKFNNNYFKDEEGYEFINEIFA